MTLSLTHGIDFSPKPFSSGLNYWSSGDGTSTTDTYDVVGNAAFVPADQDFGGCLELVKTNTLQKLRYTERTEIFSETYLLVKTRVKLMVGGLPAVRIAGWAGDRDGNNVSNVTQIGPSTSVQNYGQVYEISAIVGPGLRDGVDMVWGAAPTFAHFGLDITGPTGVVVRVDDFTIEDISHLFQRDALNIVDVRDYGAIGDAATDNYDAFVAADQAANGRRLVVPSGAYVIGSPLVLNSHVEFQGRVIMPPEAPLVLTKSFDLPTYIDAFQNEELAFKKAFQALLNSADHESLDMCGRTVTVTEPIDMQAAVATRDTFEIRRVIRNGQFYASGGAAWESDVTTAQAYYAASNPTTLSNVQNVQDIAIGSLVTGQGVGREIYVRSVNPATQTVELSEALYDAEGTQNFTFTRFKYMLDFSGFQKLSKFNLDNIEFQCNGKANGIMMAQEGMIFHILDCYITKPKFRGITSSGHACQGMLIDRCHFVTNESSVHAADRVSIAFNINANDAKIRDNWASQFRHFCVLSGANNIVSGNHFYQGDGVPNGVRLAGIVLTRSNTASTIVGNYVDNCFIEWTNEHDETPDFTVGFGFSALSISGNVFLSGQVADWFSYLVVKPHGTGHGIANLSVMNNSFKTLNGPIQRVERVDTTFADIDRNRLRNLRFEANSFENVTQKTENPVVVDHTQSSVAATWTVDTANALPFGGYARAVQAYVPQSKLTVSGGGAVHHMPYVNTQAGSAKDQVQLVYPGATQGTVSVTVRCDN